mmetsp:Transcript_30630/g.36090  ORF Transcript_30630/g.36090 Transcript_30630/m.36090 type:complete len:90 (-) Transcript_30630:901-1170(-)
MCCIMPLRAVSPNAGEGNNTSTWSHHGQRKDDSAFGLARYDLNGGASTKSTDFFAAQLHRSMGNLRPHMAPGQRTGAMLNLEEDTLLAT